jgi:hypothetical protein
MCSRWVFTVFTLMDSRSAIASTERPLGGEKRDL